MATQRGARCLLKVIRKDFCATIEARLARRCVARKWLAIDDLGRLVGTEELVIAAQLELLRKSNLREKAE